MDLKPRIPDGHRGTRVHPGHRSRGPYGAFTQPLGYLLGASARVYFAGDTGLIPAMKDLCGRLMSH